MILPLDIQRLSPAARADLIHRGVQAEMSSRLWQAALGRSDDPPTESAPSAGGARLDIDALVRALAAEDRFDPVLTPPLAPAIPTASGSKLSLGVNAPLEPVLRSAAERTGLPPAALASIIDAESAKTSDGRWNNLSRNPRSSAAGIGQFLSGTWQNMADRAGTWLHSAAEQRGWLGPGGRVRPECRGALLALRYDPQASIETTADYARANLDRLRRASVPVGAEEREVARAAYLAHHLGPGDAIRFLKGGLSDSRAGHLLAAQVGGGAAATRIAAAGHDSSAAHRSWLEGYLSRRIRPERFTA